MSVGSAGVSNYANTSVGTASGVVAVVAVGVAAGLNVGGSGVTNALGNVVPAGALYDRADSPLLDRAGNYLEVRA